VNPLPTRSAHRCRDTRHARGARRARRGFTLIECVIWITVAALVASIGAGLVTPFARERKLRAAAERVATALEYGRDVARYENRSVAIQVIPASAASQRNRVCIAYADSGTAVVNPLTRSNYVLDLASDTHLQGVEITSSNAGGDDTAVFDGDGALVDAGARFVLRCGVTHVTVRVEPYSGRVVIVDGTHAAQVADLQEIR